MSCEIPGVVQGRREEKRDCVCKCASIGVMGSAPGPWLQDARASETTGEATVETTPRPKGALSVVDHGSWILKRMREVDAQGDFWLPPARAHLMIPDQKGMRSDLPSFVASRPAGRID